MFNSGILDVVIGLVFIFLLLSLISSAIIEALETRLKLRATDLERGLKELLRANNDGGNLVESVYKHPLIYSLFVGDYCPPTGSKWTRFLRTTNLPSYIPSRNFALAVMDLIKPSGGGAGEFSGAARATTPPPEAQGIFISNVTPPSPLAGLRKAIPTLENPPVEQAVRALIDAAGADVEQARKNLERWFDSCMERVGSYYKQRSQWISMVLGLLVAIAVNADTIAIARSLSADTATRSCLVAAASEYAKSLPHSLAARTEAGKPEDADAGKKATAAPEEVKTRPEAKAMKSPEERVQDNLRLLQNYGLPLGWQGDNQRSVPQGEGWVLFQGWLLKVLGWLMTAMAVSMGAPFWFDLLNKFMNARSSLKPAPEAINRPK